MQTDQGSPSATTEVQSQREDDTTMGSSESIPNVGEEPAANMISSALLAQFTGEGVHGSEGDTFGDWLEQFELCAVCVSGMPELNCDQSHLGRVGWKPRCFTCGSFAHMQRKCPNRCLGRQWFRRRWVRRCW